jgi:hypothetical protein
MPLQIHDIELADGSQLQNQDRIVLGQQWSVANAAGASAGASVTVAVAFALGSLPTNYAVICEPNQNCFSYVTAKTNTGFNVVLTPTSGSITLAAGTFDIVVVG